MPGAGAGPLRPYRVLDLTTSEGWLCGRMLADLGADVLLAGAFGPADEGPQWRAYNRGKRAVHIDLHTPAGRDQLLELAAGADVLVESFGPGGLDDRGLGVATLLDRNPRLVVTSISPFGLDGPYATHRGPDLVVTALSGLLWLTGDEDRPPVRIGAPQAARHASAEAAVHTVVALQHAARTGQGQHVDVAALPAMVRTLMNASEFRALQGVALTRLGSRVSYAANRPRHVYRCADGHVTFMGPFGALGGPGLARVLAWADEDGTEVPALLRDVDLFDARAWAGIDAAGRTAEVVAAIEDTASAVFARRTKAELYRVAVDATLLLAPVSTLADLLGDGQLASRGYWEQVDGPDGTSHTTPGPWAKLSRTPIEATPAAPRPDGATPRQASWARARHLPPPAEAPSPDALHGLKVWDMSWVGVGPLTARYLADHGATVVRLDNAVRADVLRVNPPFAGGVPGINRSQFYADFNASKLGLGVDLARPEGREVARRMAAWADVVVESFTPKVLAALGLGYEALAAVNPSLVMLSTCMQGQTGPNRNYRGFGQLMGSLTGFYELTGWPDRDPAMVYGAYTDFISQRFCATALLAAIDHRRRTGEGQHLDVSQLEASLHLLGPELAAFDETGALPHRHGNRDAAMAPHGVYPCRPAGPGLEGERWVALACQDDTSWAALVAAMGTPGWALAPALAAVAGRRAAEDELDARLAAWTCGQEADELAACLQPAVAAAVVRPPEALHDDPQLRHLGYFRTLEHTVMGPQRYNGMQARLSATPGRLRKAAPCIGEDTFDVLVGLLGCSEDEVADLLVAEAVEIDVS